MDEYGYSDRRKTKNDKKMKRKNRQFKRGGRFRTTNISNKDAR